jgi:hypothetical protein
MSIFHLTGREKKRKLNFFSYLVCGDFVEGFTDGHHPELDVSLGQFGCCGIRPANYQLQITGKSP